MPPPPVLASRGNVAGGGQVGPWQRPPGSARGLFSRYVITSQFVLRIVTLGTGGGSAIFYEKVMGTCALTGHSASGAKNLSIARLSRAYGGSSVCFHVYLVRAMPDAARRIATRWAMRPLIKTAALALLPLVLGGHAQAAGNEGTVITLSCDGTLTRTYGANKPADPEPLQKDRRGREPR
jgi:hypothetical protein